MRTATFSVAPLRFTRAGKENVVTRVSRWLVAVATIVLLVACANVANLFLARATRRRREVAVRLALGISRGRLIRLLVGESVVLGLVGGVAGLAVAYVGGKFIRGVLLPNVAWTDAPVDVRVFAVTALTAFVVGLVVGLAPALQGTRLELTSALKSGIREGGAGRSRVRAVLTVTQAAMSVVLLVGAGLFVTSLVKVTGLHLGIEPDKVITVSFDFPSISGAPADAQARERLRRNLLYEEALRRVRALPGVAHAAVVVGTPFQSSNTLDRLRVLGRDSSPRLGGEDPMIRAVSDDYFATAGTRVLQGRAITAADVAGGERVTVVNETMARVVWPKGDAIGACLLMDSLPCARVVGVVEDTRKFALKEDPTMQYYIPLGGERYLGFGGRKMFVRAAGDVAGLRQQLRAELGRLDPTISFITVEMLQDSLDPQIRPWRLGATMFGIFGALTLLVAAIGLYSVIAYLVAQRAHELGVRIALGAQVGNIVMLVMRHGLGLALVGVVIGSILALNGGRLIEPLLFETSPRNPMIFGLVALVLLVVALLASVVPAWRASRVDPIVALRAD
jgi:predicted permease